MENTIIFKIYVYDDNKNLVENKDYTLNLNEKIIDVKNKILLETFNNKYNHLDMENITDKVYKDYGKLFFNNGLLPYTIDNYKLSEFTYGGRIFSFIAVGTNINKIITPPSKEKSSSVLNLKNIFMVNKNDKNNKNMNNEFSLNQADFPSLK